jgi:transmembrane Fragile-X-F protein
MRQQRSWQGGKVASGLIFQIAAIALIVLKLTSVISWAWLWVLSPLWIEGILVVLGAAFGLLVGLRWYGRKIRGDDSGPERESKE